MLKDNSRILIVDDFEISRVIIRKALNDAGFKKIEEARDGEEALRLLESAEKSKQPFQLVLCDWNMPKMTGIELLRRCRQDPRFRGLPFVMVTAEIEESSMTEAMQEGATDYLVKPFSSDAFLEKIRVLEGKLKKSQ